MTITKLLYTTLLLGSGCLVQACHQQAAEIVQPAPANLFQMKLILPAGSQRMDSAQFRRIMSGQETPAVDTIRGNPGDL